MTTFFLAKGLYFHVSGKKTYFFLGTSFLIEYYEEKVLVWNGGDIMKIIFDMNKEDSMMDLIMTIMTLSDDVDHVSVHVKENPSKPNLVQEVLDARESKGL